MDDLISRQAVLEATSAKLKITGKENAETVYEYIKKLCGDIKAIPSAQKWIPCSERLPEEYVQVLCYQPKVMEDDIWIGYLNENQRWVKSTGFEQITNPVTAWMPLPEPAKFED